MLEICHPGILENQLAPNPGRNKFIWTRIYAYAAACAYHWVPYLSYVSAPDTCMPCFVCTGQMFWTDGTCTAPASISTVKLCMSHHEYCMCTRTLQAHACAYRPDCPFTQPSHWVTSVKATCDNGVKEPLYCLSVKCNWMYLPPHGQ